MVYYLLLGFLYVMLPYTQKQIHISFAESALTKDLKDVDKSFALGLGYVFTIILFPLIILGDIMGRIAQYYLIKNDFK